MHMATDTSLSRELRGCWAANKVRCNPVDFGGIFFGTTLIESVHLYTLNLDHFSGGNPYLTFHCASQGTILIDLAPEDKEYQSVEEEVS